MRILAVLMIIAMLCACGEQPVPQAEEPQTPVEQPASVPELTDIDRSIIMLLREQLSGAYDTKDAVFAFERVEVVEGAQCRIYSMSYPDIPDTKAYFAVLADQSVIYQQLEGAWIQVYSVR